MRRPCSRGNARPWRSRAPPTPACAASRHGGVGRRRRATPARHGRRAAAAESRRSAPCAGLCEYHNFRILLADKDKEAQPNSQFTIIHVSILPRVAGELKRPKPESESAYKIGPSWPAGNRHGLHWFE